jgi:signal transduction histidine kinase
MTKMQFITAAAVTLISYSALADDFATPKEAEAMVAKAAKAVLGNQAATFKEITAKDKKWTSRDLYVVAYDMNGKCLAHGQNEKQVGRELIDFPNADGKEFIK